MRKIGKLIVNEQIKIYARIGTWVMLGLLLLLVVGAGLLGRYAMNDSTDGWRQQMTEENAKLGRTLAEGTLSGRALQAAERSYALNEYRLTHDMPPLDYGVSNVWSFADLTATGMPNLVDIVTLFTIITAAGIVAAEFSSGTIKLLLIRPVGRSTVLLSKYAATLLYALTLMVLLIATTLVTGLLLFGTAELDVPHLVYAHGEVTEHSMLAHVMQAYGFSCVKLLLLVTLAFMISAAFRSSSLAIGLSLFLLFAGPQLVYMLQKYDWSKFILFANTDLRAYYERQPFREGMTLGFSIAVLAVYYVIFVLTAWYLFRRRDVTA
jgi:ABC-2 type transport system permease protein